MKISAQWRSERPSDENPVRDPPPLMHTLPGGGPCESPPDQMHTWHHGIGREFVASCIASFHAFRCHACMHLCGRPCIVFVSSSEVLLACRFKIWGGSNIDGRLERAHASFNAWRIANKENTSLSKFELKTFKMTSCLSCNIFPSCTFLFVFVGVCIFDIAVDLNRSDQVAMPSTGMWKRS